MDKVIVGYGILIFIALCYLVPLAYLIFADFHGEHKTKKAIKKAQAKKKKLEDLL